MMLGGKKPSGLLKEVHPWEYRIFASGWFLGKPVRMIEGNGATPVEQSEGRLPPFGNPSPIQEKVEVGGKVSFRTYPVTLGNSIYFLIHFDVTVSLESSWLAYRRASGTELLRIGMCVFS